MGEQPRVRPTLSVKAKPVDAPAAAAAARMRADLLLVEKGLFKSRNRAQAEIRNGAVFAGDRKIEHPNEMIAVDAALSIKQRHNPYVSRGGLKLAHALDHFGVDPKGLVCLDVGASTGGFTQVLLQRGAAKVYAIDVGERQFHDSLRGDPRVVLMEKTDARALTRTMIPEQPGLVVCDVSFISATLALPRPLALAAKDATAIILVKPQFEAGKAAVGKGGVVRDTLTQEEVVRRLGVWLGAAGWTVKGSTESPIKGGEGNVEFLLCAVRAG